MTRSTAAQEASRANGAKSSGPKTAKGKRRSARNAVKHNLRGRAMLERAQLPEWLREIELELVTMLGGDCSLSQREWIDQLLLAWLQLERVDALIDATGEQAFAGMEQMGAEQIPAFLDDAPGETILRLARLHAYRRRFRGRRDACVRRLFKRGMPRTDAAADDIGGAAYSGAVHGCRRPPVSSIEA